MVYDQAQSPRLGQRTPVESTYVQIFDVDPSTPTADLVEAAYPGMLIYRTDTSQLYVFNAEQDAWQDVAGGVAGHLTFVGPSPPVANLIGDTWFDDDDGYKQYVWDGDSWEVALGQTVTHTVTEYAVNASETVAPTTGWSVNTPTRAPGTFIWVRTTTTKNDGSTSTTNPALMTGNTGVAGPQGSTGSQGSTGAQGISISVVTPFYQLVAQPSTAPANPGAVATPPGPWTGTEPAYQAGMDLYTTSRITYSNTTYSYTTVVKSSSYTAASNAQATANTKTRAYYLPGLVPDPLPFVPGDPNADPPILDVPADPYHMKWAPLTTAQAGVTAFTTSDIWYQTDAAMHPWYWDGTQWLDIKDPSIDYSLENSKLNSGAIGDMNTSVENVSVVAFDAHNTANTADGRVSMSDYEPTPDDVTYTTTQYDPDTLELVEVEIPRNNGSVWFTRTRARQNMCTNPTFETGTADWSTGSLTSLTSVTAVAAVDGTKVGQVVNDATAANHYAEWKPGGVRQPCVYGQVYTASSYAKLITGKGAGIFVNIVWYDALTGGNVVASTITQQPNPVDLIDAGTGLVTDWQRTWVTDTAPLNALSFLVRVNSPAGNASDTWQIDGIQVEASAELGRYFDGDSFDAAWDDATKPNACSSSMEGTKITQIYELHDSNWNRKYLTDDTRYFQDASKLVGTMDGGILTDNTVAPDKAIVTPVFATEAIAAGDMVHVWNNNGVFSLQKACAAPGLNFEAHGFVLDQVPSGTFGKVYHAGYNPFVVNLAPGMQWLSSTPGKVSKTPPSVVGSLVQRIGYAPASNILDFQPVQSIRIT